MIKSLAVSAIVGALVIALPMAAPEAEANPVPGLAKSDRLTVFSVVQHCTGQVWPGFDAACLRDRQSGGLVKPARLVAIR